MAALLLAAGVALADAYSRVQQLDQNGDTAQALAQANAYLAQHPDDPQMRFIKANLLSHAGDAARAEAELVQITQTYPELAEPWNNLAVLYASQGRLDAAQEALASALRIDPDYATALENMGDVRLQLARANYAQAKRAGNDAPRIAHKLQTLDTLLFDARAFQTPQK